jgi:hypothetical protein
MQNLSKSNWSNLVVLNEWKYSFTFVKSKFSIFLIMGVKLVSVHEVVAKPRTFNDELKYYIIIIIIIIIIFHII